MHEQSFVIGAQIVTSRAVLGEVAVKAKVVAVPGMVEDHDGTAEASYVQQRSRPLQQDGRGVVGRRCRRVRAMSGEEVREQLALGRHGLFGDIWLKYQVAQLARILSTLLTGGIPLVQAMETAADSLGTPLLQRAVDAAGRSVREGQPLSGSLKLRACSLPWPSI